MAQLRKYVGPAQCLIEWVLGALSTGLKRPGSETDRSPPTGAKVKKTRIYRPIPPYVLTA
jgi:hypothetical protein